MVIVGLIVRSSLAAQQAALRSASMYEHCAGFILIIGLTPFQQVDPQNTGLAKLKALVDKEHVTAGKSTIGDEKAWNVFMRLDSEPVRCVHMPSANDCVLTSCRVVTGESDTNQIMDKLRTMKNNFRG